MNEIIEILLVIVLGGMMLFFVVGGGGQLGGFWNTFCDTWPQFCGSEGTALELEIAEDSAEGLTCAINAVILGDLQHPCLLNFDRSLSSSTTSNDIPLSGLSGSQTATGTETDDLTKLETDASVDCSSSSTIKIGGLEVVSASKNDAENYCKQECEETDCKVTINELESIDYYVSQKANELLRCDCYCNDPLGSVYGLVAGQALTECQNKCEDARLEVKAAEIFNCNNVPVNLLDTNSEATKFYTNLRDNGEVLHIKGRQCICRKDDNGVRSETDWHYVYGPGSLDNNAMGMCNAVNYGVSAEDCTEFEGQSLLYQNNDIINKQKGVTRFQCAQTVDTIKCTVNDFKLPQKVGDVEDWIAGYGDPQFLLYWNEFPIEENTWSFKADWKIHALIGAMSVIPAGRVLGIGAKVGVRALTGPSKRIALEFMKKELKAMGARDLERLPKEVLEQAIKDYTISKGRRYFAKELMKEQLKSLVTSRLTAKNIKSIAIKGLTLEGAVLVASLVDSMSDHYVPHGNNVVLKSPYDSAQKLALEQQWSEKPVVVQWKPDNVFIYDYSVENLHLVSPCYLKTIEVKKGNVNCKRYIKSMEVDDGNIEYECDIPGVIDPDPSAPRCGVFDERIDNYLSTEGAHYRMNELLSMGDVKLFEHDQNGDIEKIYFPMTLLDSGSFYYAVFGTDPVRSGNEPDGTAMNSYNYYPAELYRDNEKIKNIEIKCITSIRSDGMNNKRPGNVCSIKDSDIGEIAFIREIDEDTQQPTRYLSQSIRISPTLKIIFEDGDEDDNWDTLKAQHGYNLVTLSDISGGYPNYISTGLETSDKNILGLGKGCNIPGIVVDLSDLTDRMDATGLGEGNDNYCVRHNTEAQSWTEIGITIGSVAGSVLVAYLSGGVSYIVLAGEAVLASGTGVYMEYQQSWPGPR